jgi:beta-glucanase (GH16 family)
MIIKKWAIFFVLGCFLQNLTAQIIDPFKPDFKKAVSIRGMVLAWHDEFNKNGKPDSTNWRYEKGFVRNNELQWYQPENATCVNGVLLITGDNKKIKNPDYIEGSRDWKKNRDSAQFTSSSIQTRGLHEWRFGRFIIRARIDTTKGAWPAIWTLGANGSWPSNGEVDIMEFYRIKTVPTILANVAWGTSQPNVAIWDNAKIPLTNFTRTDPDWVKKFHTWRMDWTKDSINIYLDDQLINETSLDKALNADGNTPFRKPQFLLLNLALGGNGDDPTRSKFPIKYEVDYVRVYQDKK